MLGLNEAAAAVIKAHRRGEALSLKDRDLAPGVTAEDIGRLVKNATGCEITTTKHKTAQAAEKKAKKAIKKTAKKQKKRRAAVVKGQGDLQTVSGDEEQKMLAEVTGEVPAGLSKAGQRNYAISQLHNTADARISKSSMHPDRQRLTAARVVVEDPTSTEAAKVAAVQDMGQLAALGAIKLNGDRDVLKQGNGGDIQPDVSGIPSIDDLHQLEKLYKRAKSPAEKADAGMRLTRARLAIQAHGGRVAQAIKDTALVAQLQAGDGGKSVAQLVASEQDRVTAGQPASIGGTSGGTLLPYVANGRDRLTGISRQGLAGTGRTESEPVTEAGAV
jgi:hypothetical protein